MTGQIAWKPKPEVPVINWRQSLTKGLVFDANYFTRGGLGNNERVAQLPISSYSAGLPGMGQGGAVRVYPGSTGVDIDTYTTQAAVNSLTQFTIEIAVRMTGAGGANLGRPIYKGPNGARRWNITIDDVAGTCILFVGAATANGEFDGPSGLIVAGVPHHLVWSFDYGAPSTANFYIDGIQQTLGFISAPSGAVNADSTLLTIGNSPDLARSFGGEISHCRIWNRLLKQSEVTQLYENPWKIYDTQRFDVRMLGIIANAYTLAAVTGTYAITGAATKLGAQRKLALTAGSYLVSGAAAALTTQKKLSLAAGAYLVTGASALLAAARIMSATAGSYAVTGAAAALSKTSSGSTYTLAAAPGSYLISGAATRLAADRKLSLASGSYGVTGAAAATTATRKMQALAGNYLISGAPASLVATRKLSLAPGAYGITGFAARTASQRQLAATAGSYFVTGAAITATKINRYVLQANAGSYFIQGNGANLIYSAAPSGPASEFLIWARRKGRR